MKNFKFSRLVLSIALVILFSFSLLYATVVQNVRIPFVSDAVHSSVSFVNRVFSIPVRYFTEKTESLSELVNTYDENEELKDSISSMKDFQAENDSLKRENESLKASLKLKAKYADKALHAANVLDRNSLSWSDQLTIDSGKKDGIANGMLVLANGGLVGVVKETYAQSARVHLFSNTKENFKVPVKVGSGENGSYGVLSGYDVDSESLLVSQLNGVDVKKGSSVVTSDLSGVNAGNLSVGTVTKVETNSTNLSSVVYVKPAANFSAIYSVVVVENN